MGFGLKNMNSICRICMKTGKLKSIFKFKDRFNTKYEDLSKKLNSIGGTDIHIDDKLPHNICEVCSDTLILAYDFKTLCKTTDAYLKIKIYTHNEAQKDNLELNSYGTSKKTYKDIKQTKMFNEHEPEEFDSNEDIDRNYEDSNIISDTGNNSDCQLEDDTNVNLDSDDFVPVDSNIISDTANNSDLQSDDVVIVVSNIISDTANNSDCQLEDDTNVNLDSDDFVPVDSNIISDTANNSDLQSDDVVIVVSNIISDTANNSDCQLEDDTNVNLDSDDFVLVDSNIISDTANNSDCQLEDDTNVNLQSDDVVLVDSYINYVKEKKYKCYACDKFLQSRWERQLHEDLVCSLMPPGTIYKCRLCPARVTDRDKFDNHIWRQHRGRSPPTESIPKEVKKSKRKAQEIMCEQCGMLINTMTKFKIHCLKHQGKYSLNCKECPFKTTISHSYNCHMKYYHLGHELLKCPHCTFKTHRRGNLNIHMRRHTGERPYPCSMCDYKGINHSNWKKHMTKHTNYKGFECKLCEKSYASNGALKLHTMTKHENVKMFYCKPCHRNYVGDEVFNRHLQKKHNMTDGSGIHN